MTNEYAAETILNILDSLNGETYPETQIALEDALDAAGNLTLTPYALAGKLHNADATLPMPPAVAAFLTEIYRDEIQNGNPGAMCNMGNLYYTGRFGEKNYAEAMRYYTMGDAYGDMQCTENLGFCYYYGRCGEPDYRNAFHCFIKCALNKQLRSLYKIGDMYRSGYYVEKDLRQAFLIYKQVYDSLNGDNIKEVGADIALRMGDSYCEGIGVEINFKFAFYFYQQAEFYCYERLEGGDFFSEDTLKKAIRRQAECREQLTGNLPVYEWAHEEDPHLS